MYPFSRNRLTRRLVAALPDSWFDRLIHLKQRRRWPNLRRPRTFNEKQLWLKQHYRNPLMVVCSDKLRVRGSIRACVGEQYTVPLLAVYDQVEQIDPATLPRQFALKASHGSGWNILCHDRDALDWPAAREQLRVWLQRSFQPVGREWCYADPQPKLLLEPLLLCNNRVPDDYKVYCFNGIPRVITVDVDRFGNYQRAAFDVGWNELGFVWRLAPPQDLPPRPAVLDELLAVAQRLSAPFPFCRVDCYVLDRRVLVGELTFFPQRGVINVPDHIDRLFGDWLKLPSDAGQSPPAGR